MKCLLTLYTFCLIGNIALSQWAPVTALAPHASGGGMLLLSDGSVIVKTSPGGTGGNVGNLYDRLTPNINGSYQNGTWTTIAPMASDRLYYSSEVLKDGRVYVAGGEYGAGSALGEVYDPLTNIWTNTANPGSTISDANSEILEDGRVLQALVTGNLTGTELYNPGTNIYVGGPNCLGIHNESVWIKLPDNSILFVNRLSTNSERYIPATNTWITDANVPTQLYDQFDLESGGALLLPDGRALFFGSTGHNAYYTPSGSTQNGVWHVAPDFPNGLGTPDAPAVMMVNGRVLCDASPIPNTVGVYRTPTTFFEYDPATTLFTAIAAPDGNTTLNIASFATTFLSLPDGNILFAQQGTNQYYIYTPNGAPQDSWRPKINTLTQTATNTFQASGTQFNGISEGATYGDDWQMNSNYPIMRLVSGTNVYYARTSNWNSTGVARGTSTDNVTFVVPAGLPNSTYSLYVVANGIASLPVQFIYGCIPNITITGNYGTPLTQSSTWIKSSAQTNILNTSIVKLDADPTAGYVELKPILATDYFLASPADNTSMFVAQALDGCGSGIPNRISQHIVSSISTTQPISTTQLINVTPIPPRHRHYIINPAKTITNEFTLEVFPNPTKSSFIVKSNDKLDDKKLQLFDLNGNLQNIAIENIDSYNIKVTWGFLSSGTYILKITSKTKTEFKKVFIQGNK